MEKVGKKGEKKRKAICRIRDINGRVD